MTSTINGIAFDPGFAPYILAFSCVFASNGSDCSNLSPYQYLLRSSIVLMIQSFTKSEAICVASKSDFPLIKSPINAEENKH